MTADKINVNSTDINSAHDLWPDMPFDLMGLFFFAYRDFVRDSDKLLEQRGFGRAHHRVLYFVAIKPGMPVADLLGVLKITKQSLARVLRQLIDEDYIVQTIGQNDRRQRLLSLTEKGQDLIEILSRIQSERIGGALKGMSDEQISSLRSFFGAMVDPDDGNLLKQLRLKK